VQVISRQEKGKSTERIASTVASPSVWSVGEIYSSAITDTFRGTVRSAVMRIGTS
jgi:hypothetical protein